MNSLFRQVSPYIQLNRFARQLENFPTNKRCKYGLILNYYQNTNKVKEKFIIHKGVKHGKYVKYFENGLVAQIANYKKGQLNGTCEEYNDKGQLILSMQYEKGNLKGAFSHGIIF